MLELKVRVAVPEPPGRLAGLTAGLSPAVPETERDTDPEKWFRAVIMMTDEPLPPAVMPTDVGLAVIA